jgi:DNA polymerase elongation subunit (family B)
MSNNLIYGKNPLENVVSIEIEGDKAIIFTEKAGVVSTVNVPHKFWLLSNEQLDPTWVKMKGNQHYQYGKQVDSFFKVKNIVDRYKDKDIFQIKNSTEGFQIKDGYTYFKGLKHDEVSILSFDIETNGLIQNNDSRIFLISNTYRVNGEITRKLFAYDDYENDGEMLEDWCSWVQTVNPSIMCGHNIFGFDLPYMNHVARLHNTNLDLGRNGSKAKFMPYESKYRVDGSRDLHYFKCHVYGRELIDTMFLAYKYDIGRKYESYGLKPIIKQENLEVEGREFYDAMTIKNNYKNPVEWAKIKRYAEHDADDSLALYDLMAPAIFYFTRSIPKPFQTMVESATGSQLNALMIRSYLQEKHSIPKSSEAIKFEGAYSFGIPGIYRNVAKIDVKSEYPSCILQYEIYDREKDPEANFYKMVEFFTLERFRNKALYKETGDRYYYDMEQTQKVAINSSYGLLGATGLVYNSPKNAALVTEKGRETIATATLWASGKDIKEWVKLVKDEEETEEVA